MARKIIWTKRANDKLNQVINFLENEWGENVTRSFVIRVHSVANLISEHPKIGTLEKPEKDIRGFLLTKHNRLFYRTTETEIIILNLFDTRSGSKKKKF